MIGGLIGLRVASHAATNVQRNSVAPLQEALRDSSGNAVARIRIPLLGLEMGVVVGVAAVTYALSQAKRK